MLAMKALSMNDRIQVLSRLTLRSKLTAYFTELAAAQGSNVIRLPMNREDTAAYIGTNRSALSRELSRMREEGLIDYRKNELRILR
ncbi:MAG: winged helix-turn-helix domain-containing protein [Clostridia bacterium]|nr:winged helix-turn-helix domain-containing protein [Clostridia bacterium]